MTIEKIKKRTYPKNNNVNQVNITKDNWIKCNKCKEIIYKPTFIKNMKVCPHCNKYYRFNSLERIDSLVDENSFVPFEFNLKTYNPLQLDDYLKKLDENKKKYEIDEAVICGTCKINNINVVLDVMDSRFLMGSMGSVVGEEITYSIEYATLHRLPLIIVSSSGGARMQEGIISLMQMAKTSSALTKLDESGGLYISVLTDPTYGGVTASFATLADIILAEKEAMIGFAGPNVIKQTINEELPANFQSAEELLKHGLIDRIVERSKLRDEITKILKLFKVGDEDV